MRKLTECVLGVAYRLQNVLHRFLKMNRNKKNKQYQRKLPFNTFPHSEILESVFLGKIFRKIGLLCNFHKGTWAKTL